MYERQKLRPKKQDQHQAVQVGQQMQTERKRMTMTTSRKDSKRLLLCNAVIATNPANVSTLIFSFENNYSLMISCPTSGYRPTYSSCCKSLSLGPFTHDGQQTQKTNDKFLHTLFATMHWLKVKVD